LSCITKDCPEGQSVTDLIKVLSVEDNIKTIEKDNSGIFLRSCGTENKESKSAIEAVPNSAENILLSGNLKTDSKNPLKQQPSHHTDITTSVLANLIQAEVLDRKASPDIGIPGIGSA